MSAYLKFFELEKSPFDTSAQSNLVLGTKALRGAFAEIEQGMDEGSARICVTGDSGMGKTSLARALPKLLGERARVVLLLNPSLPWATLRAAIVKQLELDKGVLSRKALTNAAYDGRRLVLAVDQAELTSEETLEHLDILLGYRSDSDEQLITCILLTNMQKAREQDECPLLWWLDKLNTLQLEFSPIPAAGVQSYIAKHLKRAGWKGGNLFSPEAAERIHRLTGGVPRKVSDTCERVLEEAADRNLRQIGPELVEQLFGEAGVEPASQMPTETAPRDPESATLDHMPAPGSDARTAGELPTSKPAPRREVLTPRSERPTPAEPRSMFKPVDAPISLDAFFGGNSGSHDAGISSDFAPLGSERGGRGRIRMLAAAATLLLLGGAGAWFTYGSGMLDEDPAMQTALRPAPPSRAPASAPGSDELLLARKKGPITTRNADGDLDDWLDPLLGPETTSEASNPTEDGALSEQTAHSDAASEEVDSSALASAPSIDGAVAQAGSVPAPGDAASDELAGSNGSATRTTQSPAAPPASRGDYADPAEAAIDKPFW
jgi:type II secretory pathway predicted ATPase ExeA